VSWPVIKLGALFNVSSGGTPSRSEPTFYEGGDIHWIKTGDLHQKEIISASEFITEAGLKNPPPNSTRLVRSC
jgi:type I restriction enzyme S subunit